eukprot:scaffold420383_cov53-Prasinocladus_malaysianus.AAC.1
MSHPLLIDVVENIARRSPVYAAVSAQCVGQQDLAVGYGPGAWQDRGDFQATIWQLVSEPQRQFQPCPVLGTGGGSLTNQGDVQATARELEAETVRHSTRPWL